MAANKAISLIGMRLTQKTYPTLLFPLPFFINSGGGDTATPIICGRQIQD